MLRLQATAGNRAVAGLVEGLRSSRSPVQRQPVIPIQRAPATEVTWTSVTKTDSVGAPAQLPGVPTSFTFAEMMDADPLSSNPGTHTGSKPDGTAAWWPWFQARHNSQAPRGQKIYWVQGHLLNDNLHGPGTPKNLVPLSNTSNTNMETKGERAVKNAITKGEVVHYRVTAVWDRDPADRHRTWGLKADGSGPLVWGEQFAPSSIYWQATLKEEKPPGSGTWVDKGPLSTPEEGWYNTFPDPGHVPSDQLPVVPKSSLAVMVTDVPLSDELQIAGIGFTDGGSIKVEYAFRNVPNQEISFVPGIAGGKLVGKIPAKGLVNLHQIRITDLSTGNWIIKTHSGSPWS